MQLLTPDQVAERLQVGKSTVYKNAHKLGGFYPVGIKVLRFNENHINGIMEGKQHQPITPHVQGSVSNGTTAIKIPDEKTNPSEHGL